MSSFRPATLKERKYFYEKEFNQKKYLSFFRIKPKFFAVDLGTETKIISDPKKNNKIIFFRTNNLRKKLINYLPEDVYYDRNIHKGKKFCLFCLKTKNFFKCKDFLGQELIFDVDADNIKCSCKKICSKCINKSVENAFNLAEELEFKLKKIVYSGRGCHVHVLDKKAYNLSEKERKKLAKKFKKYGIDTWVSEGKIRLVRLPFSLNGLVSRISIPLNDLQDFKEKKTLPKFLR